MRDAQHLIESIQNRSTTPDGDAEESVRTLVSRLESGSINMKAVPRIIESKCIEKITAKEPPTHPETTVLVNSQTTTDGSIDTVTQVTVNNHISMGVGDTTVGRANKVARNRNVDLAFNLNKSRETVETKAKEIVQTVAAKAVSAVNTILERNHQQQQQQQLSDSAVFRDVKQAMLNQEEAPLVAPRLVKWNTLSKFDEKNYLANDAKLKLKPKYDEIEFEEFEVYDPNNPVPTAPQAECYDSLNSK